MPIFGNSLSTLGTGPSFGGDLFGMGSMSATNTGTYTTATNEYISWCTTSSTTTATTTNCHQAQNIIWREYYDYGAQQDRQARTVRAHAKAAKDRAQELLLSHLTPEQQRTLKKNKWFVVEGGKSKQQYRIRSEDHLIANIDVLVDGRVKHKLCAHCDLKAIPLGDQLLAQKVMLEVAEDEFLRVANRHAA